MKFEIDFNHLKDEDNTILELLGAKLVKTKTTKYPPFKVYKIEINTFEELEKLIEKVDELKGGFDGYAAVISFDPPTIFLDKDV